MHQKNNARKKILKKGRPVSIFWLIFDPFWELKTFKNHCKNNGFEAFSRFLQKLKKTSHFGSKRGSILGPILELIWKSAAPETTLFARLLSQGYLQIHTPKETT
jgi:hypothetical protein